jgi:3-hydroxyacyl-[acyl-carrier-protein] dehydratase
MIDRVDELEAGVYAKGFKNVSYNEPHFQGHFPGLPIMPGVLQVEACAQLACMVMLAMPEYTVGYAGLFTGIDGFKFRRMVVPGDKLDIEVRLERFRYPFGKFTAKATVNGELCVEGSINFAMQKTTDLKY